MRSADRPDGHKPYMSIFDSHPYGPFRYLFGPFWSFSGSFRTFSVSFRSFPVLFGPFRSFSVFIATDIVDNFVSAAERSLWAYTIHRKLI